MEHPSRTSHHAKQHLKRKSSDVEHLLRTVFGHSTFRPHQEKVCRAAAEGHDLLLVMPTGAGKSLCFQVPGLARGGTTLVVSPLIALMEDQVAKLKAIGLKADRIHAGRSGDGCRQAFADYHQGRLDFLYVAPERVAAEGFFEMISERTPTLIAIDEAHCISQWGHDFRPEYRMLGQRLQALRPTPIIALTATATAQVQEDIINQLGIPLAERFIHGFRRVNIAIQVQEVGPGDRLEIAEKILSDSKALPAIIYAPTRKYTESYAAELSRSLSVAPYHAGMPAEERDRIQSAFINGEVQVVVATIAFGMGIDKQNIRTVIHMALPSTVEGYYQEIGRAGRDGKPSQAILMHSFIDRRTHEFLFEKNYPQVEILQKVYQILKVDRPMSRNELIRRLRQDEEQVAAILDKLWIHGGAYLDADGQVFKGKNSWEQSYRKQRKLRALQLLQVAQFAEANTCRMKLLVEHFDDRDQNEGGCGHCDVCNPSGTMKLDTENMPSNRDFNQKLLNALETKNNQAAGKLFRECFEPSGIERKQFEHRLEVLARRNIVKINASSFYKDGRWIEVRKIELTPIGNKVLCVRSVSPPPLPPPQQDLTRKPVRQMITNSLTKISVTKIPISPGSQVKHDTFGLGNVEQIIEEFGVGKAIVNFSKVGLRKLAVEKLVHLKN